MKAELVVSQECSCDVQHNCVVIEEGEVLDFQNFVSFAGQNQCVCKEDAEEEAGDDYFFMRFWYENLQSQRRVSQDQVMGLLRNLSEE